MVFGVVMLTGFCSNFSIVISTFSLSLLSVSRSVRTDIFSSCISIVVSLSASIFCVVIVFFLVVVSGISVVASLPVVAVVSVFFVPLPPDTCAMTPPSVVVVLGIVAVNSTLYCVLFVCVMLCVVLFVVLPFVTLIVCGVL